jgi:hypothetical protein
LSTGGTRSAPGKEGAEFAPPAYGIEFIDRGLTASPPPPAGVVQRAIDEGLRSPGESLEGETRASMEARFGHDFSGVRVHTDAAAGTSARAADALAYTVGSDLVFAPGEYEPDTPAGHELIAHELVHVVQQHHARLREQAQAPHKLSDHNAPPELEAERITAGETDQKPSARPDATTLYRFEARMHEAGERYGLTQGGALTNEEASAVYFGNWMRDMNQVFVPLLTGILPPDVLFSLISYMAATKFGRELTPEQFGYYIPAEHLDNPAGLVAADDLLPSQPTVTAAARPQAPERLGAPRPAQLDTRQEPVDPTAATVQGVNIFAVDQTGVMAFVRRTNLHVERRLQLAADAGRNPDGMQHFGAAQHAVEDLFAHSNYVEIAVDRLLRTDPTFLRQVTGAANRQVFTYSAAARVGDNRESRPVLTTGTFTGTDTKISIASEVVGLLSRPLPEPATLEEQRAQDRFMVTLIRNFETRLRASPELQRVVRQALREAGVPGPLADRAHEVPLANIYELQTFLRIPIPDAVRVPMKREIRRIVSREVLQPAAGQVQAEGLEARVADTSLIRVLRESQRQQRGEFSGAEREAMRQRERLTGQRVSTQEAESRAAGGRRATAIQATPLHVVAGPSHSQIAKDHPNSPFFGLAFLLKTVAVQRLRDRMLAAWAERRGSATTPFDFDWASFPAAAPTGASPDVYNQARGLYHSGRPARGVRERESLQTGRDIVAQGGQPGQPYDLAVMRRQAAQRIRAVAAALRAIAGVPGSSANAIDTARGLAGRLVPEIEQRLSRQLADAQAAARTAAASQTVADMNAVADSLGAAATAVETARQHADRESANAMLVQRRQEIVRALASRPTLDSGLAGSLLYLLDQEIQATAVSYSSEQRRVLEGRARLQEMSTSSAVPTVSRLTLPQPTGSPATVDLLNESRLLLAHPYESNWWQHHVRDYAQRFPDRLINDIEARNEGVPFYRTASGAPQEGH